jgi:hypothetical protein
LDPSFELSEYLAIEQRLFNQLDAYMISPARSHPLARFARYVDEGPPDPSISAHNWNRTTGLIPEEVRGGVLLLSGYTDSPCSMRASAIRHSYEVLPANGRELNLFDINHAAGLGDFFRGDVSMLPRLLHTTSPLTYDLAVITIHRESIDECDAGETPHRDARMRRDPERGLSDEDDADARRLPQRRPGSVRTSARRAADDCDRDSLCDGSKPDGLLEDRFRVWRPSRSQSAAGCGDGSSRPAERELGPARHAVAQ